MRATIKKGLGLSVLAAALISALLWAPTSSADDDWKTQWKDGFKFDSADGKFKLKFGGRIQADWTFPSADDTLPAVDDTNEFRRARIFFEGTVYENVEFKAQYDFAGDNADFKDVYIGLLDTPIGNLRFGHFKEPFSLEELTSSKYITFLERSLPNAFAPARNSGFMIHDGTDRFNWAVGAFRETDDDGNGVGGGKHNITGRLSGTPLFTDKSHLVHLGVAYTMKDFGGDPFRFSSRPEARVARFVDTGNFAADSVDILNFEFATVQGPFWASAEYTITETDAPTVGDPSFDGFYVQAGVFLTGESRNYKASEGVFDRNKPKTNFGKDGYGAWELAVRYSTLDLTDEGLSGGEIDDISFAVNWYLNPVTRIMLNYVTSDVQDTGDADIVALRFQIDF